MAKRKKSARDPSRTTTLRRKWMGDINRKVRKLKREVQVLLVDQDVLGIADPNSLDFNVSRQEWRFLTDGKKIESFKSWLQDQVDQGILAKTAQGDPWTNEYIHSAYRKGVVRAYNDVNREGFVDLDDFYIGGRAQFLRDAFAAPETVSKLSLLYTRAFDQLKGFTDQMSQQTSRILATGLANGYGPRKIAREMNRTITSLTRKRALTIARTETIYAHAEGQLDSMERLGIEEVDLMAEWSTAGDDRVCEQCAAMSGKVMTIAEARGLIPLHPNCRCAWIPVVPESKRKGKLLSAA